MKKTEYFKPTCDVLVVRFEGCLCGSPNQAYGTRGAAGGTMTVNNLGEGDEDLY